MNNKILEAGLKYILIGVFIAFFSNTYAQKSDSLQYVVKKGDCLIRISIDYGNPNFWHQIYKANRDKIDDPDLIYPKQKFIIPVSVTSSPKFIDPKSTESDRKEHLAKIEKQKKLEAFRKAFSKVLSQKGNNENKKKVKPRKLSNYSGLEIGGLVIDETRSKMGKDFFNLFYQYWEAPENAQNFMLTIEEQPVPSLGTLVTVKIDDRQVYRSRLQPRYAVIESMAKRAVAISYYTLQQRLQTSQSLDLSGF